MFGQPAEVQEVQEVFEWLADRLQSLRWLLVNGRCEAQAMMFAELWGKGIFTLSDDSQALTMAPEVLSTLQQHGTT